MRDSQTPPLIAVDIGNSAMHFGLFLDVPTTGFPNPTRWMQFDVAASDFASLRDWLPPESPPWLVASVNREGADRLFDGISQNGPEVEIRMLDYTQLSLELGIEQPQTAGLDRLVAAVAVNALREPDQPAIVVDFGTAITVDAVGADGTFLGGAILPGMALAARALVDGTSQLPAVNLDFRSPPRAIGKSTEPAIRGGLFWGAVGAVSQLSPVLQLASAPEPVHEHSTATAGREMRRARSANLNNEKVVFIGSLCVVLGCVIQYLTILTIARQWGGRG